MLVAKHAENVRRYTFLIILWINRDARVETIKTAMELDLQAKRRIKNVM